MKTRFFAIFLCFLVGNAAVVRMRSLPAGWATDPAGGWEFGGSFFVSKNLFAQEVSVAFDLESPLSILYDANFVQANGWPQSSWFAYFQPADSLSFATQNISFEHEYDGETQERKTTVGGIWAADVVQFGFESAEDAKPIAYNASFGLVQSGDHFLPADTQLAFTGRLGVSLNGSEENWTVRALRQEYDGLLTFGVSGNDFYLGLGTSDLPICDPSGARVEDVVDTSKEIGKQQWQVEADGWDFGRFAHSTPQFLRFTLATPFVVAPQATFNSIVKQLGAYEEGGRYVVDCSQATAGPTLSFEFAAWDLSIRAANYVQKDEQTNECFLLIRPSDSADNTDHWAVGSQLLRAFCLSLDFSNARITFQPLKK
ncbi:Renin-like isoform X2 [Aphelenchoides fujianensis]|nr:Renin-like isoform X2 [Aphelenchoides fujianensis]